MLLVLTHIEGNGNQKNINDYQESGMITENTFRK